MVYQDSVELKGTAEQVDDDSFVWFCPQRCKSMPYFDIKMTFSFKTWKYDQPYKYLKDGKYWDSWTEITGKDSFWKGNGAYRESYDQSLLTNSPSENADGSFSAIDAKRVTSVGVCKQNVMKWNELAQTTECSVSMPHVDLTVPASGISECFFRPGIINTYIRPCFQTEASGIILVKPAYVFYPGATGTSAKRGTCEVVRYAATDTTAATTREARAASSWDVAPTYQKHTYEFKKLPFDYTKQWYREDFAIGTKLVERNTEMPKAPVDYNKLYTKKYEWSCRACFYPLSNQYLVPEPWGCTWKTKYMQAKQYESKCSKAPCHEFITPPCWENVYSIAASPCAWQKRVQDGKSKDGFVTLQEMTQDVVTEYEYATRMHAYGGGSYMITFPPETIASTRASGASWEYQLESGKLVSIAAQAQLKIELKAEYSCHQCSDAGRIGVWGMQSNLKRDMEVTLCRRCEAYESVVSYVCTECTRYHMRRDWLDKSVCVACPVETPMRRSGGQDKDCKECQVLDYFNGAHQDGCLRLQSVMDGRTAGAIKGVDQYYSEGMPREIMSKHYRVVQVRTVWSAAVRQDACDYTANAVGHATELSYRRWCGHREIVREQQALLKFENASYLYANESTTVGFAGIGNLCQKGNLKATTAGVFDLTCTDSRDKEVSISVVRSGHAEKCTVCRGGQYTRRCWPTYHADLASEEAEYFEGSGRFQRMSSNGTCAACAGQCAGENHYMQPTRFSCMWNGTANGRMLGAVTALPSAGLYYWYKQSPCVACADVYMNTTHAMLHKQCGNKRTYRTWDPLQTRPKEERSIPLVKTCCSMQLAGKAECTESEYLSWINENCQVALSLLDVAPVKETYCPPGWYVDKACAESTPAAWAPDCCKRCGGCAGSMFKTESFATCTGATFIDTERNGCNRDCLSNSYMKDGNCYRCESCSTTGTGEHGRESV